MKIGVECAHAFGDCLFINALIRELAKARGAKITVATRQPYRDAFYNVPWVSEIIPINSMGDGTKALRQHGCTETHQITQNVKFFEFKQRDGEHSLIDTPLWTGRELGLPDFDQRPIFNPTSAERSAIRTILTGEPTIAIESEYRSGQSWATIADIKAISDKFANRRILWLSNKDAPPYVDDMLRFTRRQAILALQACDVFFSVGSGFFCSALALPESLQPRKIVCLWDDSMYKYERRLAELQWHKNITWVHNKAELEQCLSTL